MNLLFGKIVYINTTLDVLAPSIPRFKLVVYTDVYVGKTIMVLYTYNNKYVRQFDLNLFSEILKNIKMVMNLPYDRSKRLYYGDELYIELINENGDRFKWYNVEINRDEYDSCSRKWKNDAALIGSCTQGKDIGSTSPCYLYQGLVNGTVANCSSSDGGRCIIGRSKQKLTRDTQMIYESATKQMFDVILNKFGDKIPEKFVKGP
jgi:hypothetical protein